MGARRDLLVVLSTASGSFVETPVQEMAKDGLRALLEDLAASLTCCAEAESGASI